jgi:hypothetical protein
MKKLIIIDTYPNTEEHIGCLNECVDRLTGKGYDLMVVSHYPVSLDVQKKVDYCIFDKENIPIPYSLTPYSWMANESFYLQVNAQGHSIAICKSMYNGISTAKSLGYDFFFFMEADNLLHEEDIDLLDNIQSRMHEEDKKMIFFKNEELKYDFYETLIFGGSPEYFIEKVKLPLTLEEYKEWLSESGSFVSESLEISFYKKFLEKERFLVIDESTETFFKKSKINKYSGSDNLCVVITNNLNNQCILFLKNFGTKTLNFKVNDVDNITEPGCWSYRFVENNAEISVLMYQNDEIVGRRHFSVTEENRSKFTENGFIEFK